MCVSVLWSLGPLQLTARNNTEKKGMVEMMPKIYLTITKHMIRNFLFKHFM